MIEVKLEKPMNKHIMTEDLGLTEEEWGRIVAALSYGYKCKLLIPEVPAVAPKFEWFGNRLKFNGAEVGKFFLTHVDVQTGETDFLASCFETCKTFTVSYFDSNDYCHTVATIKRWCEKTAEETEKENRAKSCCSAESSDNHPTEGVPDCNNCKHRVVKDTRNYRGLSPCSIGEGEHMSTTLMYIPRGSSARNYSRCDKYERDD